MRHARSSTTRSASPTTPWSRPSGWAGGSAALPSSRRTSRWPTSGSTSSARPACCSTYAGELEGAGAAEDDLAYLRDDRDFRNVKLVERPMTDFGVAMARLLVFSTYQLAPLPPALATAPTRRSPASPRKAVKEVAYHVDHATHWVLRLGDGTEESHARMQAALDAEWPYVDELFAPLATTSLAGRVVDPAALRDAVARPTYAASSSEATLTVPEVPPALGGGRAGLHTEHLGYLLAEMQHLHRSHPGATW